MAGEDVFPAWACSAEETLSHLRVDASAGLSEVEVKARQEKYGLNELEHEEGTPFWKLVLEQFEDTLVRILLAAAAVSFLLAYLDNQDSAESGLTAYVEPFVILLILIINACVGVWQESNAERALEALKEMQSDTAKVIRNGELVNGLLAKELVPGDIVELRVGDKVPADMRILKLHTSALRVEQSSLTGESVSVLKSVHAVPSASCELQAKDCMVFAGTTVVSGSCISCVVTTGMRTEIGKIQQQIAAAAAEEDDTPLKKKLDEFGERLTYVIGAICLLVWLINYRHFLSFETDSSGNTHISFSFAKCTYYFKIAVALAVAAIPEGLPAVITTCLALGTRKMAAKNAIVRKLPSVETLGCTTVICSDKTGTLTTNQMSVTHMVLFADKASSLLEFDVEGTTYDPTDGGIVGFGESVKRPNVQQLAEACAMCNDAGVELKNGSYKATGLPTEAALRVLVEKIGVPEDGVQKSIVQGRAGGQFFAILGANKWYSGSWERAAVLEFDRTRKSMGVLARNRQTGKFKLFVKGAVENILERSDRIMTASGSVVKLDAAAKSLVLQSLDKMSSRALRCLALAYTDKLGPLDGYNGEKHRGHALLLDSSKYSSIESGLVLVAMVGLEDPPRPEVSQALEDCRAAGIKVMVITGDNKNTAEAVCRDIGLFGAGEDLALRSFLGREFLELPEATQRKVLQAPGGKVFSRAEPKHKQDIVRMLREDGEVVAMTGDGVNDAPALKLADIGVAMGIAGTEVAKEASDMVLADDNFSTIVAAVSEGRSIYDNMKAFIRYMISSNMGEVASIFLTAALGMPENLIPVQLLWVNLVTDGPPATALGFNPPDLDIMRKPPRRSEDKLISAWVFFRYLVIGAYVGIATVGVFAIWYTQTSFLGIDLSQDGHSTVTLQQLRHWPDCRKWDSFSAAPFTAGGKTFSFDHDPCDYFEGGKVKATTLSLSVLVAIEMFNSLNALSEDTSLFRMPPWVNPWLLLAMAISFGSHFAILYIPFLADIFGIVPLSLNEWLLVVLISFPVILIDEVLKKIGRSLSPVKRPPRRLKTE